MKYTKGFSGGPRIDTRAGSVGSVGTAVPTNEENVEKEKVEEQGEEEQVEAVVIVDKPASFDLVAWIKENQLLAGGIVLGCISCFGFFSMMMIMVAM